MESLEMKLNTFAKSTLLSSSLDDKLIDYDQTLSSEGVDHLCKPFTIPKFPLRPKVFNKTKNNIKFPNIGSLEGDFQRGVVLHYFANHELLAMELMALAILKFPETPEKFRKGLAKTISEEQSHLRLYIKRMQELGVQFGDIPLNNHFWNIISPVKSPLEFISSMSLTLEQANLDFSCYYKAVFEKVGDIETAKLMETVLIDEIGHVKHGLYWFNKWRHSEQIAESDWEAFCRLLPAHIPPIKTKGTKFYSLPRLQAGLSEEFVRKLRLFNAEKSRPGSLWCFHPLCEELIPCFNPHNTPKKKTQSFCNQFRQLAVYLASNYDSVLVSTLPSEKFLDQLNILHFPKVIYRTDTQSHKHTENQRDKFSDFKPWGWNLNAVSTFKPMLPMLTSQHKQTLSIVSNSDHYIPIWRQIYSKA